MAGIFFADAVVIIFKTHFNNGKITELIREMHLGDFEKFRKEAA